MPVEPDPEPWYEAFKAANAPTASQTPPQGENPSAERRQHPRFPLSDVSASLHGVGLASLLGIKGSDRAVAAMDLSEGGVKFKTTAPLKAGARVWIALRMLKHADVIEAAGVVRWSYRTRDGTEVFTGVRFNDLAPPQARKIASMREWFTSPRFQGRRREKPGDGFSLVGGP